MPRIEDHPVVLARLRAGVSRSLLAEQLGVHRTTIAAIEEGRTQEPTELTLLHIDRALHLRPGTLKTQMQDWRARQASVTPPTLTLQARSTLSLAPEDVLRFASFARWRERIAPTRTAFASLLGLNHTTVARYEEGLRVKGMPDTLAHALLAKLNVSPEYLSALKRLPPS